MKRTKRIHIRTTDQEHSDIVGKIKIFQYKTVSDYVRDTALQQNKDHALQKAKSNIIIELRRIGTNINQIAVSLNTIAKYDDNIKYDLSNLNNLLENIKKDLGEIRGGQI